MIKSQCSVFVTFSRFVDFKYFITANQTNKSIVDVMKRRRHEWLNSNMNKKNTEVLLLFHIANGVGRI
jgi:hypothetical protein